MSIRWPDVHIFRLVLATLLLIHECERRKVTHLGRTEVLDGAGIGVACAYFPCLALQRKLEEWRTVKPLREPCG